MKKRAKGLIFLFLILASSLSFVSAATNVYVDPASSVVLPGASFDISIKINTTEAIWADSIILNFNKSVLNATSLTEGDFLKQGGSSTYPITNINNSIGEIKYDNTRFGVSSGATGQGTLFAINFKVIGSGQSVLGLSKAQLLSYPDLVEISATVINGTVRLNNPPNANNLQLNPSLPTTIQDLIASYDYSDPDGDLESGTEIRWYKNAVLQTAYNEKLNVPNSATAKGEKWYFTVKPKDGLNFGTLRTSSNVTIQNSAPVINWFSPSSLVLKLRAGINTVFNHTSSDVDSDALSYAWKFNNVTKATTKSWLFSPNNSLCGQHKIKLEVSDLQLVTSKEWDAKVLLRGDVNEDNKIGIFDLAGVGLCYGKAPTDTCANADLNKDGSINIFDLATVGLDYGKTC